MPGGQEKFSDEQLRRACDLIVKGYVMVRPCILQAFPGNTPSSILRIITHVLSSPKLGTSQGFSCPRHESV